MAKPLFPSKHGVEGWQRFSKQRVCPICAGHPLIDRGKGRRCYGYISTDGLYAHCTREDKAGGLDLTANANTYAHKLAGDCACGTSHGDAPREPMRRPGRFAVVADFIYRGVEGEIVMRVVRLEPKSFRQGRPDGKGGWTWNLQGTEPVLYRLPELAAADRDATVYVAEGEGVVDALRQLGVVATTNCGGALKWRDTYNDALCGRHVALLPDNDSVGQRHARDVARRLKGIAASVVIVELPGLPAKGDAVQWIAAGGTREELDRLTEAAREAATTPRGPEVLVRLSDVQAEQIQWIWPGRLPASKLVTVDGDPGLGKSTMVIDWAARISRGLPFPGSAETREPAGVVLLSLEDGLADTIRPRLEAAGADLDRVAAMRGVMRRGVEDIPSLPHDLGAIASSCRRVKAKLLVVDPLSAYFDGTVDSHKDQDVRRALTPVGKLAEELGVLIVVVRHLTKNTGAAAIHRGGGSMGIVGAARCGLVVARDPDDEQARVLATVKSNLAVEAQAIRFRLETTPFGVARVVWLGASRHSANDLLAAPSDGEERTALSEAVHFLTEVLGHGPLKAQEIAKLAAGAMVAQGTLRRAREQMQVVVKRIGFGPESHFVWSLPADEKPAHNETHSAGRDAVPAGWEGGDL